MNNKEPALAQIVNCDAYALNRPHNADWHIAVAHARAGLQQNGCSVLPDFIHPNMLSTLAQQSEMLAPHAYYTVETVNAYNTDPNQALPAGHPASITFERGNAFVARDLIPKNHLIHLLYTDLKFKQFLAACFNVNELYELSDPLAGLCVNVVQPDREHPWHFDTNEFTVSLLTKPANQGGVFQYCSNIRTPEQENLSDVYAVITGNASQRIQNLELKCGDLQLFKGRYSLHRVNKVIGDTERHTAIFAYTQQPNVIGNVERTRQLFGRVLPEHYAAQHNSTRSDKLMD